MVWMPSACSTCCSSRSSSLQGLAAGLKTSKADLEKLLLSLDVVYGQFDSASSVRRTPVRGFAFVGSGSGGIACPTLLKHIESNLAWHKICTSTLLLTAESICRLVVSATSVSHVILHRKQRCHAWLCTETYVHEKREPRTRESPGPPLSQDSYLWLCAETDRSVVSRPRPPSNSC